MAQSTWDQDANITVQNVTASGTLTVAGKLLTPPASAGTLATLGNTETLVGKTLTAPTINTATIAVVNATPGATTAALGTNVGNAAALPAGTATVYPTTAADGTVGVVIHANDKVTGRMLFIGNGVSNAILKVYGPSGAVINGAAADAAFSTASGKGAILYCLSGVGNSWLGW